MTFGSTVRREMKETSITARDIKFSLSRNVAVLKSDDVKCRMFVFSIGSTCGCIRSFQASCPYPTSIAKTNLTPCWRRQSVNPPVDAPTSSATRFRTSTPKVDNAFSSLSPPRLTYFCRSCTTTFASGGIRCPGLILESPLTVTAPARDEPFRLFSTFYELMFY